MTVQHVLRPMRFAVVVRVVLEATGAIRIVVTD